MNRPSKKDIKAAVDKLKDKTAEVGPQEQPIASLSPKKTNKNRIRKQGI